MHPAAAPSYALSELQAEIKQVKQFLGLTSTASGSRPAEPTGPKTTTASTSSTNNSGNDAASAYWAAAAGTRGDGLLGSSSSVAGLGSRSVAEAVVGVSSEMEGLKKRLCQMDATMQAHVPLLNAVVDRLTQADPVRHQAAYQVQESKLLC